MQLLWSQKTHNNNDADDADDCPHTARFTINYNEVLQ